MAEEQLQPLGDVTDTKGVITRKLAPGFHFNALKNFVCKIDRFSFIAIKQTGSGNRRWMASPSGIGIISYHLSYHLLGK